MKKQRVVLKNAVIVLLAVMLLQTISAADWDNIASYNAGNKTITIYNWNFIGQIFNIKLAEYTLLFNSESCLTNCYAEGIVKLYEDSPIFETVNLKDSKGGIQSSNFEWFIEAEVTHSVETPNYEEVCADNKDDKNSTKICEFKQVGVTKEDVKSIEWVKYNRESLKAGTYKWRLEGTKGLSKKVDWVMNAFGKDFIQWAWWDLNFNSCRTFEMRNATNLGTRTSQPMVINLTGLTGKLPDNNDVRIVNTNCSNGGTEVSRTVVDSGSDWATVAFVYSGELPANYSVYYYNLSAVGVPTNESTLTFFDEFNDGILDTVKWNTTSNLGVTESGGLINLTCNAANCNWRGLMTFRDFLDNYTYQIKFNSPNNANVVFITHQSRTATALHDTFDLTTAGGNNMELYAYNGATEIFSSIGGANDFDWHTWWLNASGASATLWKDKVFNYSKSNAFYGGTFSFSLDGAVYIGVMNVSYDYLRVWNSSVNLYSDVPTITVYAEQYGVALPYFTSNAPINYYNSSSQAITFNKTVGDDGGITNVTLIINGTYNQSNTSGYNGTNYIFTQNLADGYYNWTYNACDDGDHCKNDTTLSFTVDTIAPQIDIVYPAASPYNTNVSELNYTFFHELTSSACWYSTNLGVTNTTITCADNVTGLTSAEGSNTWRVYGNDTAGNNASDSVTFTKDTINPYVAIIFPENTTYLYNISVLNYAYSDVNAGSCWYSNDSGATNFTSVSAGTNFTSVPFVQGLNVWDLYCNDSYGNKNHTSKGFTISKFTTLNENYNSTTYETSQESFQINISYNSTNYAASSKLVYNATSYTGTTTGTGNNITFSREITIPTISYEGNNTFYWNISFLATGTEYSSSDSHNQTVGVINISKCLNSSQPNNVTFLNLTFADETTLTSLNASINAEFNYWLGDGSYYKNLNFLNSSLNDYYEFCAAPNSTFHNNITVQYASTGYPQRRKFSSADLTNTTTSTLLYLLAAADGIYSVYQVQDSNGNAITGVSVSAERQISGVWYTLETGTTDSAGAVTFWLNPNYDHRLTFIKSGYSTVTVTIRPSSTTYTVVMSTGAGGATYNSTLADGVTWRYGVIPQASILSRNTTYTFWFWVNSTSLNLIAYKMELLNNTGGVITTTVGTSASGSNITSAINIMQNQSIRGRFSIDSGSGYYIVDADAFWPSFGYTIPPRGTVWSFIKNLNRINVFGEDEGRKQYSMALLFFILLFIVLGAISYSTGWDFATAGGAIMLLFPIVIIASMAGFFNITYIPQGAGDLAAPQFLQKYTVAIITGLLSLGYIFNKIAEGRQG